MLVNKTEVLLNLSRQARVTHHRYRLSIW